MTEANAVWPEDRVALATAKAWVESVVGSPVGEPEILQTKIWGVTSRFGDVVLKVAYSPIFPQIVDVYGVLAQIEPKAAANLLAHAETDGQYFNLFEFLPGETAEAKGTSEALVAVARELARVQAATSKMDLSALPVVPVEGVVDLLLQDDLSDQPSEIVEWLHEAAASLRLDAVALAKLPLSLDHPDVNASNAMLQQDGTVILLDWEEATVGCPIFSLERLLGDAREHGNVEAVCDAYLGTLPWGDRDDLERAMRLAPLKLAWEFRTFARKLGWGNPHTRLTTACLKLACARVAEGFVHTSIEDYFGE